MNRLVAIIAGAAVLAAAPSFAKPPLRADGDQMMPVAKPGANKSGVVSKGASLRSVEWKQNAIPVCWIDPDPADAAARETVRQAVHITWEAAANVRLVGWDACTGKTRMVRIRVSDSEWPRATVGNLALSSSAPSMFLNFHLARHPSFVTCAGRDDRCLRFTSVHEFGHMLGLIHEQDRPETPADCIAGLAPGQRQHQDMADLDLLTGYDPDSLMNYCSKRGYNPYVPLVLSNEDAVSIRKLFGPPPQPQPQAPDQPPPPARQAPAATLAPTTAAPAVTPAVTPAITPVTPTAATGTTATGTAATGTTAPGKPVTTPEKPTHPVFDPN